MLQRVLERRDGRLATRTTAGALLGLLAFCGCSSEQTDPLEVPVSEQIKSSPDTTLPEAETQPPRAIETH